MTILLVEKVSVTHKPLSALMKEVTDIYGAVYMAEYDWALPPKSRETIHETIMVRQELPDFDLPIQKVSYLDGCKVYFENGWIITRFSGTEPRVRIFAEMPDKRRANALVEKMAAFVGLPFDAGYARAAEHMLCSLFSLAIKEARLRVQSEKPMIIFTSAIAFID